MDEAEAMNEQEFIEHYPATVDIPVQWGEQDGFGHINNAVFIRWLEASRIQTGRGTNHAWRRSHLGCREL